MTLYKICHQSGRVLFTTDNEVTARNREQFGWKVTEVDKSREQFEQWFPEMVEGMPPSMVEVFDKMLFIAWQASRAAIEVELPRRKMACASGYGDGYLVDSLMGDALEYDETVEAIRAAGLRVKVNDIANGTDTE